MFRGCVPWGWFRTNIEWTECAGRACTMAVLVVVFISYIDTVESSTMYRQSQMNCLLLVFSFREFFLSRMNES